jgi:hypothetical protein
MEGAIAFSRDERKLVHTEVVPETIVSTVFLGLDHGYGGIPILWETMVFSDDARVENEYQRRYHTREEALRGHEETVAMVRHQLGIGGKCNAPLVND